MRIPKFILLLAVAAIGCTRTPTPPAKKEIAIPPPKILQFYGSAGETVAGAPVTICYGVENARAVRLEPAVEKLTPSFNRCFQVTPDRRTTYTLTAEGADGRTVSESFTVSVSGRPAAVSNAQMIRFFATSSAEIGAGQTSTLCYGVAGAKSVKVEPQVQQLKLSDRSCFLVKPAQTTTYKLTATSPGGRVEFAELTVTVK